ncbi:hypothetical protein H5410_042082 [Solanum commersonii]|uniref:Uncharacterized protein n=1 Tax=Solanum commersonii TaxID=4109 RepID=A0A9J5XWI0_SOLCO|nr:hypothetical protein H5410_042082 [Solanum commersonii]
MAIEGDVIAASTTNVRLKGGKKNCKGKKHQKGSEEMLLDPTLSEVLTSHPPSTTEASDDDRGDKNINSIASARHALNVHVRKLKKNNQFHS